MFQCSITFRSLPSIPIPIPCLTDCLLSLTTLLFANLFVNLTIKTQKDTSSWIFLASLRLLTV